MYDAFNAHLETLRIVWQRPWARRVITVWTLLSTYDLLLSQVVPTPWAENAPRIRDFIHKTSGWFPFWWWLLVLPTIFLTISLLLASPTSTRSLSLLVAAWISVSVATLHAPALFETLTPHDAAQPAQPPEVKTAIPAMTSLPDPVSNVFPSHQPDLQQAQHVEPTKPEPKTAKPEPVDPRTDTSEDNKEFTNKPAAYFVNTRKHNTSIRAKKLLEPYDNALFRFSGKVINVHIYDNSVSVFIELKDGYQVFCTYPKSSTANLSRLDIGDAISGVGTINDEFELPAVVLWGCHSK